MALFADMTRRHWLIFNYCLLLDYLQIFVYQVTFTNLASTACDQVDLVRKTWNAAQSTYRYLVKIFKSRAMTLCARSFKRHKDNRLAWGCRLAWEGNLDVIHMAHPSLEHAQGYIAPETGTAFWVLTQFRDSGWYLPNCGIILAKWWFEEHVTVLNHMECNPYELWDLHSLQAFLTQSILLYFELSKLKSGAGFNTVNFELLSNTHTWKLAV